MIRTRALMSTMLLAGATAGCDGTVTVRAAVRMPDEPCAMIEEHELSARWWRPWSVDSDRGCGDMGFDLVGDDGSCWTFAQLCGRTIPTGPNGDPFFRRDTGDPPVDAEACREACL